MSTHSPDHEVALLEHLDSDDPEAGAADAAEQAAACADCLSYLLSLYDDTCALHDRARSRMAQASPPRLAILERIDMLLDDVMILLAHRDPPGGGGELETGGEQAVPVGQGQRS